MTQRVQSAYIERVIYDGALRYELWETSNKSPRVMLERNRVAYPDRTFIATDPSPGVRAAQPTIASHVYVLRLEPTVFKTKSEEG